MNLFEVFLVLFMFVGIAMIVFIGKEYAATWRMVRSDYQFNCYAFCRQQLSELVTLEFQIDTGNVLCMCSNLDIEFYGNNYSYVRKPNLSETLLAGKLKWEGYD